MEEYESFWAMRHPHVFASMHIQGHTDLGKINPEFPHQNGSNLDRVWGQESWNIMMADTNMNVWDWFDYSTAYYTAEVHMAPLKITKGSSHEWKSRGDRPWGGEPRMVWNQQKYRQAFTRSWAGNNLPADAEGWIGKGYGPSCCDMYNGVKLNDPLVAFTNNSLDQDIGDTGWIDDHYGYGGDWFGQINGFSYFNNITETQTTFSVDLFLDAPNMSHFLCPDGRNCGLSLDTGSHADVTPRRMQAFEVNACDTFKWVVKLGTRKTSKETYSHLYSFKQV
jgi:hypothetical protein